MRLLLLSCSLLVALLVAAATTTAQQPTFDDPLIQEIDLIQGAAEAAEYAYQEGEENGRPRIARWVQKVKDDDKVESVTVYTETFFPSACYFAMTGRNHGFDWVSDINMNRAYIASETKKRKRCRIVKEYKKLYAPKAYHEQLLTAVEDCISLQKQVVFTGHDIGGALATLYGVALEAYRPSLWVITFGAPPLFMPPQYEHGMSTGALTARAGKKKACPHLNFQQYLPFVNTEANEGSGGGLAYDFMPFVNTILYQSLLDPDYGASILHDCFIDGAETVQAFEEEGAASRGTFRTKGKNKGNLGAPWGQYIYLPPTDPNDLFANENQLHKHLQAEKRQRTFSTANRGVTTDMLPLAQDLNCRDAAGSIHDMGEYARKVRALELGDASQIGGFANLVPCNFDAECRNAHMGATCQNGACEDPTARSARRGMRPPGK